MQIKSKIRLFHSSVTHCISVSTSTLHADFFRNLSCQTSKDNTKKIRVYVRYDSRIERLDPNHDFRSKNKLNFFTRSPRNAYVQTPERWKISRICSIYTLCLAWLSKSSSWWRLALNKRGRKKYNHLQPIVFRTVFVATSQKCHSRFGFYCSVLRMLQRVTNHGAESETD